MTDNVFVIVSGLPTSGKSTLSRRLADQLGWPRIDKDAIMEALFDSLGVGDHTWRHRLSRAGDDLLFTIAAQAKQAVLDNWWQPRHRTPTPTPAQFPPDRDLLRLRPGTRRRALPETGLPPRPP
ncbi:AAA family ATPase [Streptomyces sp. YIM S03343]